jgi:hypothetical protein
MAAQTALVRLLEPLLQKLAAACMFAPGDHASSAGKHDMLA